MLRFQYVSCQFDALQGLPGPRAIRKALKDLPVGLDATYDRMLQATKPEYRKQVSSILRWLAFSEEPLSVEELAEIFILDHDRKPPFHEDDRLNTPENVLKYLPSLVTTVRVETYLWPKNEVRLAHFSIKEYLISPRIAQGPATDFSTTETDAHLHISLDCLAYHLQQSSKILVTGEQFSHFALWGYAATFWTNYLEHVPRATWGPFAIEIASQALAPSSQSLLNMSRIRKPELELGDLATPLYYLAGLGAAQLTELLLDRGSDIDELSPRGNRYGFALAAAARMKHINIVKVLLDRGADIHLRGGAYGYALQASTYSGNESIVQLLLDRGAEVNLVGGEFGSALAIAVLLGRKDTIRLLLDAGANINLKTGISYGNALYTAVAAHEIHCMELLISKGAEVWPPSPKLEEELKRIEESEGKEAADKLRKFHENPSEYIAAAKAARE
jgi:hypothetical protein